MDFEWAFNGEMRSVNQDAMDVDAVSPTTA